MAKHGPNCDRAERLLAWYDAHGRDLPWRVKDERPDPYKVWLSEVMLQQTTVAAVGAYFRKFVERWPAIESLAEAPLDDVLKAWAGLGYYARARNLHACARAVAADFGGRFPEEEALLRKLPGIGPYTAGAIAAIAFDRPHAAVDGNVERVMSRLYAIEEPLPDAKPLIRQQAEALVTSRRPGDFAQALMDLGATVCTPKSPACPICPWAEDCQGRKRGIAGELPRRRPKAKMPTRKGIAFWIERRDGAVLLRRRPDKGLLGAMMEVPSTEWRAKWPSDPHSDAPLPARWHKVPGRVEHTFTHFHLQLDVLCASVGNREAPANCRWVPPQDLDGEALPTVMRKVIAVALRAR